MLPLHVSVELLERPKSHRMLLLAHEAPMSQEVVVLPLEAVALKAYLKARILGHDLVGQLLVVAQLGREEDLWHVLSADCALFLRAQHPHSSHANVTNGVVAHPHRVDLDVVPAEAALVVGAL